MKTAIAWIIANVEGITTLIVVAAFEVLLFTSSAEIDNKPLAAIMGPILAALVKTIIGGIPSKGTVTDIVNLLLAAGAIYMATALANTHTQLGGLGGIAIGCGIVALAAAIAAAVFTAANINEVVSLRMFYQNSNVSLFETTWMYTFNRFVTVFASITGSALIIAACQFLFHSAQ